MRKIYLIRHGITFATINHLYCGKSDIGLTDEGKKELVEIKELYKKENIDRNKTIFITSGLKRCNETIDILFDKPKYITNSNFQEMNFGDFELKSYDELKNDESYIKWCSGDNMENVCPNGESGNIFESRVNTEYKKLIECDDIKDKDIVLVCHGGVIVSIFDSFYNNKNLNRLNRYAFQPKPGFGYVVEMEDGGFINYRKIN